jgi:predicted amidohydrolase YtcJ
MIDNAAPDLILHSGLITTLDPLDPSANTVAIRAGYFTHVGVANDILPLAGPRTRVIDLRGRRVLPGLIDNHIHIIRGGLNFNMELRWDGVRSLSDAMNMLRRQVAITPAPQWVRVVGGFSEHQFSEKRLPTVAELNAAAPDTPVFLLHLYDRALLNCASGCRLHEDNTGSAQGRNCPRLRRQSDGLAARKTQCRDLICDVSQRPKTPT